MAALTQASDLPTKNTNVLTTQLAAVKAYRGGALGVVVGTGYATPLLITTALMAFLGVALETVDNSAGSAGDKSINFTDSGLVLFDSSGLTVADLEKVVFFTDDHTVSTTGGLIAAGVLRVIDTAGNVWVDITGYAGNRVGRLPALNYSTSATLALTPSLVTISGNAATIGLTAPAPTSGTDDGLKITIINNNSYASIISSASRLITGHTSGPFSTGTFLAAAGGSVVLQALSGKWVVLSSSQLTMS